LPRPAIVTLNATVMSVAFAAIAAFSAVISAANSVAIRAAVSAAIAAIATGNKTNATASEPISLAFFLLLSIDVEPVTFRAANKIESRFLLASNEPRSTTTLNFIPTKGDAPRSNYIISPA
jgi:hypothetical protein